MVIEELRLTQFRNYEELTLRPHSGINLFFGANGSGKTNLLEAIHYCALGKSHRTVSDQSVVRSGSTFAASRISVRGHGVRRDLTVRLTPVEAARKTIYIDQKKISRFSELMGCLQCVIFSPEDLALVKEGPSVRRRYLDMMISQVNRGYFIALQQYRTGLEQRNALLKSLRQGGRGADLVLDGFEQAMAEPARVIVSERRHALELLAPLAAETYRGISDREGESFGAVYHSTLAGEEDIAEAFLRQIRESRENDLRQGTTGVGPHRDDLLLSLNRQQMRLYASQGQIRTAALSLKLSQMKLLRQLGGETPVLLLDDVMSELDRTRRGSLLREITDYQTFITCTDESDLEEDRRKRVYRVSAEGGRARVEERNTGEGMEGPVFREPDFS